MVECKFCKIQKWSLFLISKILISLLGYGHRLNMEVDLQCLFGLHVHSCTHWLRTRNTTPPPPPTAPETITLLVRQNYRRHLIVTPLTKVYTLDAGTYLFYRKELKPYMYKIDSCTCNCLVQFLNTIPKVYVGCAWILALWYRRLKYCPQRKSPQANCPVS